ncbi:MAG: hypothetical protein V2I34_00510 [Bacteroidales bacterium]|jgi:hypothetical protein|nr:hypothetical protein [Bacteroidales bacterium]
MKRKISIYFVCMIMMIISSCERPDALVINIVREDGSVSRKIILTHSKNEFDLDDCQVPVDSTWNITREYDISEKGDTTYTLTAIRDFNSVEEMNLMYDSYRGANAGMSRKAEFRKRFRWFSTHYYFNEHIDRAIEGVKPQDFFSVEELNYFYMPEKLVELAKDGPDSSHIKEAILNPLEEKTERWIGSSLAKAFVNKMVDTVRANPEIKIDTASLRHREDEITASILFDDMEDKQLIDSLLGKGFYEAHKALNDTLVSELEEEFSVALNTASYLVQTIMPGELIATNGYIDEDANILWEVKGETILSSEYNMWAESRVRNTWAWILTGIFLVFVISGFVIRRIKKGR